MSCRFADNLSLQRLREYLNSRSEPDLCADVDRLLDTINRQAQPFREWRKRRIAHKDLATALQFTPSPLPGISRNMVEDLLTSMRELMHTLEREYPIPETPFENILQPDDGETIVLYLNESEEYRLLKR